MPLYYHLKDILSPETFYKTKQEKLSNVVDRLRDLKAALNEQIPERSGDGKMLLATWNIREFDSNSKKFGPRLIESYQYIAEIISRFDIVAIQEVKENLGPLQRLISVLGPQYSFIATDITEGTGGNGERMAFIYDKNKVRFRNIAGEIVLPKSKSENPTQFVRTPFLVSFQSGWLQLNLCTVHIYYGADTGAKLIERVKELEKLALFFKKRSEKEKSNFILLGDFNILGNTKDEKTMSALLKGGFKMPKQLQKRKGSNLDQSKFYDQIVYKDKKDEFKFTGRAGVFDYFQYIFREDDTEHYIEDMKALASSNKKTLPKDVKKYYKQWRTFQMSDHLPLWIEFDVDYSDEYLTRLKK